jgi:uncharacterized protein YbgA (DUF1722 family)/uncharacterized protein YbbK (DUF523 family)
LLGERVRFDGGHKRNDFLTSGFGNFVEWVSVCPEVEVGLPTPRDSMRLEGDPEQPRLMITKSREDISAAMDLFSHDRVAQLKEADLCGFVLKKDSPSCGLHNVRVYNDSGMPSRKGMGLFARALTDALPSLPVEDEGRLSDPGLRESFVERVFSYRRLKDLLQRQPNAGNLVAFHTKHKLQLMSHSPKLYRDLGRVVATAGSSDLPQLLATYAATFMEIMSVRTTSAKHTDVLQHVLGHFKKVLDAAARRELLGAIDDYHQGLVPLVVPVTLLGHYARVCEIDHLTGQTYLQPHPKELMLRNHV